MGLNIKCGLVFHCNLGKCYGLIRIYDLHWGLSVKIFAHCKYFRGLDTPFCLPPKSGAQEG